MNLRESDDKKGGHIVSTYKISGHTQKSTSLDTCTIVTHHNRLLFILGPIRQ